MKAIVLTSFGTTDKDARMKSIDILAEEIESEYSDYDVFQSFTSKIVRERILANEDIDYLSTDDLVGKLVEKGYKQIIIQPSHIICGREFHKIYMEIRKHRKNDVTIKVSKPLLNDLEDYLKVSDYLKQQYKDLPSNEVALYMAHGTKHSAFTSYLAISYMLDESPVYLACVEGYPELDIYIKKFQELQIETIHLNPFMFVAGDHVKNDMISDQPDSWKTILEKEGFKVEFNDKGLGEEPYFRQLYLDHLLKTINHKRGCRHGK